jgi:uncharacterized protein (DUF1778 family)
MAYVVSTATEQETVVTARTQPDEAPERSQRNTRMNLRASAQQQQLIRRAAAALDKSMTDFVLDSAAAEAEKVLADRRWFLLDDAQWTRFEELLDAPVESMPRLRRTLTEPTVFDQDA